jgi:hypothetical protein
LCRASLRSSSDLNALLPVYFSTSIFTLLATVATAVNTSANLQMMLW